MSTRRSFLALLTAAVPATLARSLGVDPRRIPSGAIPAPVDAPPIDFDIKVGPELTRKPETAIGTVSFDGCDPMPAFTVALRRDPPVEWIRAGIMPPRLGWDTVEITWDDTHGRDVSFGHQVEIVVAHGASTNTMHGRCVEYLPLPDHGAHRVVGTFALVGPVTVSVGVHTALLPAD